MRDDGVDWWLGRDRELIGGWWRVWCLIRSQIPLIVDDAVTYFSDVAAAELTTTAPSSAPASHGSAQAVALPAWDGARVIVAILLTVHVSWCKNLTQLDARALRSRESSCSTLPRPFYPCELPAPVAIVRARLGKTGQQITWSSSPAWIRIKRPVIHNSYSYSYSYRGRLFSGLL